MVAHGAERACRHDHGFYCQDAGETWIMCCVYQCGYFLNFSPDLAGKLQEEKAPRNQMNDDWKLHTVCFPDISSR